MSAPREVIAVGRTAEILAYGEGRVLKLFHSTIASEVVEAEERSSRRAFELGATPIECFGRASVEGRAGLVFTRIEGESLTRMAERNLLRLRESGRVLARVHAGLHTRSGRGFRDVRDEALGWLASEPLAFLTDSERRRARAQLEALSGGESLLHMDFHTQNVFEHRGGHAVIDWQTPLCGPPAADVASTSFLLADAELFPGLSAWRVALYNSLRRVLRTAYLDEYAKRMGVGARELAPWRLPTLIGRLAGWNIAGERAWLARAIRRELEEGA